MLDRLSVFAGVRDHRESDELVSLALLELVPGFLAFHFWSAPDLLLPLDFEFHLLSVAQRLGETSPEIERQGLSLKDWCVCG